MNLAVAGPARPQSTIDIDVPIEWPSRLRSVAVQAAVAMREQVRKPTYELTLPGDVVGQLDAELDGVAVRAFHCTRLLDYEVEWLRAGGLRAASDGLMADKLSAAVAVGAITQEQADRLHADSPLHRQRRNRAQLLCAVTTRRTLDEDAEGLRLLFTHWGGEIIYFWQRDEALAAHLRSLGRPSIVVVDLLTNRQGDLWTPDPACLVVGRVLGSEGVGASVHYRLEPGGSVPVVDVWQPGDRDYDRHTLLPTS